MHTATNKTKSLLSLASLASGIALVGLAQQSHADPYVRTSGSVQIVIGSAPVAVVLEKTWEQGNHHRPKVVRVEERRYDYRDDYEDDYREDRREEYDYDYYRRPVVQKKIIIIEKEKHHHHHPKKRVIVERIVERPIIRREVTVIRSSEPACERRTVVQDYRRPVVEERVTVVPEHRKNHRVVVEKNHHDSYRNHGESHRPRDLFQDSDQKRPSRSRGAQHDWVAMN